MGKYLSPPNPDDYRVKCAVIFYPEDDGTFFLNAVRGQLSELARSYIWEGDRAKTEQIAQIFTITDMMTDDVFFGLDCDLIPLLTGKEDMNINVNCNCGCSGTPTTVVCYGQDGLPVLSPQLPVDPVVSPPIGDTWPVDPNTEDPPDDFGDWTTFDVEACAAANGLWQAAYTWVTVAEGGVDTIAALVSAVLILLPATALEIMALIGGSGVYKIAENLIDVILSEQATDILNDAKTWLEDEKQDIVCTIFEYRHDIPTMQLEVVRMLMAYVGNLLTLTDEEQSSLREFGRSIFPLNLALGFFFEYQRYIAAQDPIDCSLCGSSNVIAGWSKAVDSPTVVTIPDTLTVDRFNYTIIGNDYYGDVGGRIGVAELVAPNGLVTWSVTMRSSSYVGDLYMITGIPGNSGTVLLQSACQPGQTYSGQFQLANGYCAKAIGGYYGCHLTAFSVEVT